MYLEVAQRNFINAFRILAELDIPLSNRLAVGSVSAYGLGIQLPRDPNDADILLRDPADFYRLAAKFPGTDVTTNGYHGHTLRIDIDGALTLEFTNQWPTDDATAWLFDNAIESNGVLYMNPADYLRALITFHRDKDTDRIPVLQRELAHH